MRALSRREGVAPSTILRRIQWVEDARSDPNLDALLDCACTF